jgi:hypothetical protein
MRLDSSGFFLDSHCYCMDRWSISAEFLSSDNYVQYCIYEKTPVLDQWSISDKSLLSDCCGFF